MMRHAILMSCMAVAAFLAFGAAPGRAEPDVDGMDHSRLNHGVLGRAVAQNAQPCSLASMVKQTDPDVIGADHSKLNHGVRGPRQLTF